METDIGELITQYRRQAGLTIDELVAKSGVPKGTLTKILTGVTKAPTLDNIRAIAKALGKSLADFEEQKSSPAPAEPEAGEKIDSRDDLFYEKLIEAGYLAEGEDFTDAQVEVLQGVLQILNATFPRRKIPESNKPRKIG